MGSFFTNFQISAKNFDPVNFRQKVIDSITDAMQKNYVLAANPDEAERTIAIGPVNDKPWIAVYDEETEDQDIKTFDDMASKISLKVQSPVIGILVHDSDVVCTRLYRDGSLCDSVSNVEGFFKKKAGTKASPEKWAELMHEGYGTENFNLAWKTERVFAEEILGDLSKIFDFDEDLCSSGYKYRGESGFDGFTLLHFKNKKNDRKLEIGTEPTKLRLRSMQSYIKADPGTVVKLDTWIDNTGCSSSGLNVFVWGPAIENGILRVDNISLIYCEQKTDCPPAERMSVNGEKLLISHFPEFVIPKYIGTDKIKRTRKFIDEMVKASFTIQIDFFCSSEAKSEVFAAFLPDSNPKAGQQSYRVTVNDMDGFWKMVRDNSL